MSQQDDNNSNSLSATELSRQKNAMSEQITHKNSPQQRPQRPNRKDNSAGKHFINRRSNSRRSITDPCKELPVDLYHRKRRKSKDRRDKEKTLSDDYYSVVEE